MSSPENLDPTNTVSPEEQRLGDLRDELFDLLDCDFNELSEGCSLEDLLDVKQFYEDDQRRISNWAVINPWGRRDFPAFQRRKFEDDENARRADWGVDPKNIARAACNLAENLNGSRPDKQAATDWLREHQDEITPDLLMYLVSESRIRGVLSMMSARGKTHEETNNAVKRKAGQLWIEHRDKEIAAGRKPQKSKAKKSIAEKVGRDAETVYNWLTEKKFKEIVFPDGE